MSYNHMSQTNNEFLREAVEWLICSVKAIILKTNNNNKANAHVLRSNDEQIYLSINKSIIIQESLKYFTYGIENIYTTESSIEAICKEFNYPQAVPLVQAWLDNEILKSEELHMWNDWKLIAVAAAAAMLMLVLLLRRQSSVMAGGRKHSVSKEFEALQRVRDQGGAAAEIAKKRINSESRPWEFSLELFIESLSPSEKRTLLEALKDKSIGVEVIRPRPGDTFFAEHMRSTDFAEDGSVWVVMAAPEDKVGFRLGKTIVVPAEVDACTADWWCLALAESECPIALEVKTDPEQYIGLEEKYSGCWSIVQGFSALADLRAKFDENIIEDWSVRLCKHLRKYYSEQSGHIPVTFGAVGDPYDPSVMRCVGASPEGDAQVNAVEVRDGLPQVGFGCRGAPPLLYAVVRVEEV